MNPLDWRDLQAVLSTSSKAVLDTRLLQENYSHYNFRRAMFLKQRPLVFATRVCSSVLCQISALRIVWSWSSRIFPMWMAANLKHGIGTQSVCVQVWPSKDIYDSKRRCQLPPALDLRKESFLILSPWVLGICVQKKICDRLKSCHELLFFA